MDTRSANALLDLDLPDSSGLETAVGIQNSRPDVSIVVLTGNADFETKQKTRNRRTNDYLIKSTDVWKSLVLHIRDAIERKKGIETLKNGGQYLRSVLDSAPIALICISTQGRILEFNAHARKLRNCDKKNVLGKSFLNQCILLTANWSLTEPRLIYNQNFNDTVNIVFACLNSTIRKIESVYKLAGAEMLKKLMFDQDTSENALEKIPSEKVSAVERLVLSLLASGHDKPDHLN